MTTIKTSLVTSNVKSSTAELEGDEGAVVDDGDDDGGKDEDMVMSSELSTNTSPQVQALSVLSNVSPCTGALYTHVVYVNMHIHCNACECM